MATLIYIVDDEDNIRNLIKSFLLKDGFEVRDFASGDEMLESFDKKAADLVVLDIMLPGHDGYAVCEALLARGKVPIIFLSARDSEYDRIAGLKLGGDDYLTKPFSPLELVERIKALLRRAGTNETAKKDGAISFGDLQIYPESKRAFCGEVNLSLTIKEFDLLCYLAKNHGRAVSRDELLSVVWGIECDIDTRATDDTVKRLRKKMAAVSSKTKLETIWGYGFMLTE